jgi:hypothetical protein
MAQIHLIVAKACEEPGRSYCLAKFNGVGDGAASQLGRFGMAALSPSRGSSTTSAMATARTTFSISAPIAWHARSARFIYQRNRRMRSISKPKRTWCACARTFRWPTQNSRLSKRVLLCTKQLLAKLADVPTPEEPTPRQLGREHLAQLQMSEQPVESKHL